MRPFNLEAALSGAKLVTRGGREVKDFEPHSFNPTFPFKANVIGIATISYNADGRYLGAKEDPKDLFLADEPQPSEVSELIRLREENKELKERIDVLAKMLLEIGHYLIDNPEIYKQITQLLKTEK